MAKKIPLSNGGVALVDNDDFEHLSKYNWFSRTFHGTEYAHAHMRQNGRRRQVRMHRLLMGVPSSTGIDHKNGNGLDNRRRNLRTATTAQNNQNRRRGAGRSKYIGVSWCSQTSRWRASIKVDGRFRHIGRFSFEEEAAEAYDMRALYHWRRFAGLNFPRRIRKYARRLKERG